MCVSGVPLHFPKAIRFCLSIFDYAKDAQWSAKIWDIRIVPVGSVGFALFNIGARLLARGLSRDDMLMWKQHYELGN